MANHHTIHCYLTDAADQLVYSSLDPRCLDCAKACAATTEVISTCGIPGKRRRGIKKTEVGRAFLCSDDPEDVRSAKRFKRSLESFAAMLLHVADIKSRLEKDIARNTKRVLHNLTSLNAHTIQELYACVPQEVLTAKLEAQVDSIEQYLVENTREAASVFLRILKNEIAMKTNFSVFNKLYEPAPSLKREDHSIHKVLMNVLHIFFSDFADKRVQVLVDPSSDHLTFDYESFHVAMYHLIENATKYTLPGTKLYFRFARRAGSFAISILMTSVCISREDLPRIFDEGYSGEHARKCERAGNGIGLGLARDLLRLNGAELLVRAGAADRNLAKLSEIPYAQNEFEIIFPTGAAPA